jgi:hypothetical protein
MTFAEARLADIRPIRWLGDLAKGIARALGNAQDDEVALLKAGVSMRVPDYCPDDAVGKLAYTFRLPTFAGELAEQLRERCKEAFPTWEEAGLPAAIIRSLTGYGIPEVQVINWSEWPTPDDWFSKFWVRLFGFFGPLNWGEFNWGDATWGSTATIAQRRAVMGQIVFWKSPQSLPVSVLIDFDDGMIWGVHEWGAEPWGGTGVQWPMTNLWGDEHVVWGGFKWGTGRWITGEI